MGTVPFGAAEREAALARMSRSPLEVLVVGGGITGVGVAREAALRGIEVGLVERSDFASGTSGRSSKLIHGGVRYLAQGDFALVREAAEERRILRRLAPHLVQPRPMFLPAYGIGSRTKLRAALWAYERVARIPALERHRILSRDEALAAEPGLAPRGLQGAAVYPENLTDDARLVIAVARAARRAGAWLANYAEVVAISADGRGVSVSVHDRERNVRILVRCRVLVNASGPWCEAVRALPGALGGRRLHLTKGIHFVVSREDLPVRHMVVLQARDRRAVFAVPRGAVVYVGTTDTDYAAPVEEPEVRIEDVDYLVEAVRRTFPSSGVRSDRVLSAWAGLRPLLHEEGKAPSELSRRDEILPGPDGTISIAGGKLTTFRAMAERVVEQVERRLGRHGDPLPSRTTVLDGGELPEGVTPESFERRLAERYARELSGREDAVARLVLHYGCAAESLLERAASEGTGFFPASDVLRVEVERAVREEMALRLSDVLDRRLRCLSFCPDRGLGLASEVAAEMARFLGWSEERIAREIDDVRRLAALRQPVGEVRG